VSSQWRPQAEVRIVEPSMYENDGLDRLNPLIVQQERDHHVHLVGGGPSVLDANVLLLDPGTLNVANGFARTGDTLLDGLFKAFRRGGADLSDFGDGHFGIVAGGRTCVIEWTRRATARESPGNLLRDQRRRRPSNHSGFDRAVAQAST